MTGLTVAQTHTHTHTHTHTRISGYTMWLHYFSKPAFFFTFNIISEPRWIYFLLIFAFFFFDNSTSTKRKQVFWNNFCSHTSGKTNNHKNQYSQTQVQDNPLLCIVSAVWARYLHSFTDKKPKLKAASTHRLDSDNDRLTDRNTFQRRKEDVPPFSAHHPPPCTGMSTLTGQ